jgi:hypothetical protein
MTRWRSNLPDNKPERGEVKRTSLSPEIQGLLRALYLSGDTLNTDRVFNMTNGGSLTGTLIGDSAIPHLILSTSSGSHIGYDDAGVGTHTIWTGGTVQNKVDNVDILTIDASGIDIIGETTTTDLHVTDDVDIDSDLNVDGNAVIDGTITIGSTGNIIPMLTIDSAALATNQIQTLAHSIGAQPNRVHISLLCVTAELGYSVDDEVKNPNSYNDGTGRRWMIVGDSTNFTTLTDAALVVLRKDTGAAATITMSRWKFRIRYGL